MGKGKSRQGDSESKEGSGDTVEEEGMRCRHLIASGVFSSETVSKDFY